MKNIRIAARGLIIDNGEILVFKHKQEFDYFSMPGGGVEYGESLSDAITRELKEETNIEAIVGSQRFIQELIINDTKDPYHLLEFFFLIKNGADFRKLDLKKSSHGFEVFAMKWIPIDSDETKVLPAFILPSLRESIETTQADFFSSINTK